MVECSCKKRKLTRQDTRLMISEFDIVGEDYIDEVILKDHFYVEPYP